MPANDNIEHVQYRDGNGAIANVFSVDIGGMLIKAAVIDHNGSLVSEFVTTPTPRPATPSAVLSLLNEIAKSMPAFGLMSVGFPGVVKRDRVETAPNLGTSQWKNVNLEQRLRNTFGTPVRIMNDAIVYGLGVAKGPGRECVLTFGTGMGCALFNAGSLLCGLELGQHYACDDQNYDQYVGHAAYLNIGLDAWNERVERVLGAVHALTNCDRIHLGGGNSRRISFVLPPWAVVALPSSGVAGGARLWHADMDLCFPPKQGDVTEINS